MSRKNGSRSASEEQARNDIDPLVEVQRLAGRLWQQFCADPTDETSRQVAVVLYAMSAPDGGEFRRRWFEQARSKAQRDRAFLGPAVDRSHEADILCSHLARLMAGHDAYGVMDRAPRIARSVLRTLRTLPTLCSETTMPSVGPVSDIDERVGAVARVIAGRAERGELDPELMIGAILRELGSTQSKNLFTHRSRKGA